jgi:hypothetical protein
MLSDNAVLTTEVAWYLITLKDYLNYLKVKGLHRSGFGLFEDNYYHGASLKDLAKTTQTVSGETVTRPEFQLG